MKLFCSVADKLKNHRITIINTMIIPVSGFVFNIQLVLLLKTIIKNIADSIIRGRIGPFTKIERPIVLQNAKKTLSCFLTKIFNNIESIQSNRK